MKKKWFKISYILLLIIAVISVSLNIRAGILNPRFAVYSDSVRYYNTDNDAFFAFLGHDYIMVPGLPDPYVINAEIDKVNYLHWSEHNSFWSDVIRKVHEVYMYKNDPNHWLIEIDEDLPFRGIFDGFVRDDFVLPNRNDNEINRIVLSGRRNEENLMLPSFSTEDKKVIQEIFNSVQEGKEVPFTIQEVTNKMKPEDYDECYEMYIEYKDYPIVEKLGNLTMENDKVMIEWMQRAPEQEINKWPREN